MAWTSEQNLAIHTEGRNLLVSAAAGSGKTAVLIERIIQKMTRRENPASILDLLVVTFTNAAAAELREKIADGIMKALREREFPAETVRHLKRQLILVERADVCTIDSFCMRLVKSEIHLSEFDPSFRLVDNSEAELLEIDVLSELMEEQYAEAGEDFIALTDYFSSVGAGNTAEDQILRLFHFMRNAADPLKWLDNCRKIYEIDSEEALQAAPWNVRYLKRMRSRFDGFVTAFEKLERLVNREHIESYLSTVSEYRDMLRIGEPPETYRDFFDLARRASDAMEKRLPALKKTDSGPESERAKYALSDFRNSFKKWINNFSRLPETIVKEFERMRPIADTLIGLTKTYSERLKEEKNKRRVADFNDVEHEALRILKPDGVISDAAKALRDRYEEILIDEYQDSSELQEEILNSVARTVDSKSVNVFMVGDMKQSIYRFRMADPELFIDKYDTYPSVRDGDALTGKVELSANFRSRSVVTDTVNFFFRKLMQKEVDGVGYDDAAALDPRRVFTVTDQRHAEKSVLMTLSADEDVTEPEGPAQEENEDPADEEADVTLVEMEAHLIAKEILKLVDRKGPLYIEDRDHPGKVRPVNFGDIVILMRSTKIADQTFSEVFASYGIPCYSEQKSGFYDTFEIRFLINLLSAIDNPENDTAFFGVLRSGLFDVTSNELAEVKAKYPDNALPGSLYRSVLAYVSEFDDPVAKKLKEILDLIGRYEILSHEADLSLLIRTIAGETGLESFAAAMPGGARRLGNIRLLEEKAADFEKTSYHGIHNFIRYVARKRESGEDEGEAQVGAESGNPVRIMTMHASKGLQYPVVFVSRLGKRFNRQDETANMLTHQTMGFAIRSFDTKNRVRTGSYIRDVFLAEIRAESMGEEMRDLYVAMTRAEEKLYLTGAGKKLSKTIDPLRDDWDDPDSTLTADDILEGKTTLALLFKAYASGAPIDFPEPEISIKLPDNEPSANEGSLKAALKEPVPDAYAEWLKETFRFPYRYDDACTVRSTLSVSLLKRMDDEGDAEALLDDKNYHGEPEPETKTELEKRMSMKRLDPESSAARGTLYHKVLEHLDPTIPTEASLKQMVDSSLITASENDTIDAARIQRFLESDLGRRMREAYEKGTVHREKPFIMSLPIREVFPKKHLRDEAERVMIQGVIDLYFEEPDGLVLVDYKTDLVSHGGVLAERYRKQLDYYEKALQMMTKKQVKERWIYSLSLNQAVEA